MNNKYESMPVCLVFVTCFGNHAKMTRNPFQVDGPHSSHTKYTDCNPFESGVHPALFLQL